MDQLLRNIAGSVDQVVRQVCAAEVQAAVERQVPMAVAEETKSLRGELSESRKEVKALKEVFNL